MPQQRRLVVTFIREGLVPTDTLQNATFGKVLTSEVVSKETSKQRPDAEPYTKLSRRRSLM